MRRVLNDLKIMLLANLWIVPVVAALVWALFQFVAPPPLMSARMATGSVNGAYHQFALRLQSELVQHGFELHLHPTSGSRENLALLLEDNPSIEIAMVQSGLERSLNSLEQARLESLGSVYQEPLWLFHRRDVTVERLGDLAGLRVGLGGEGSGTRAISDELLTLNGFDPAQYPQNWQSLGGGKAASALQAGELDAAFFVGPAENATVKRLAQDSQVSLSNISRVAAYRARLPFLNQIEISEGLLDLAANSPERNVLTLSPVATLVVNDEFNPGLVPLFLQASAEVMQDGTLLDAPGAFPSADRKSVV